MTYQQLKLSKLSLPLIVLILSHSRIVRAQAEATKDTNKTISTTGSDDDTDTECNWDASLGDYLSCTKEKFTTTQLVGAGIGVTLLIFALAFGTLWLVRRRQKPIKNKNKNKNKKQNKTKDITREKKRKMDEEKAKADKEESEDEDSESEYDESDDDEGGDERKEGEKHDRKGAMQKNDDLEKGGGNKAAIGGKDGKLASGQRRVSRAVTVEDEDESGELHPPTFLTVPTSRSARSSRIGSPTETRSIRQLYPSNPDRNSVKHPTRPQRPPSTQWLAGTDQGQESQPSMPPPRYSSKPPISSNLRPADNQTVGRSPSPSAQRPVSSAPGTQPVTHHPPTGPRSASVHITDASQLTYNDMPLPVPPAGAGAAAAGGGTRALPARSSSRASLGPNTNKQVPPVPSIPEQSILSGRAASVYPEAHGQGQAPNLTQNPASNPSSNSNSNTKALTPGMQAVRQTVSAPSNHGVRASSVSVSVHEGDPDTSAARAESRKSVGPGGARQSTVLEEKVII